MRGKGTEFTQNTSMRICWPCVEVNELNNKMLIVATLWDYILCFCFICICNVPPPHPVFIKRRWNPRITDVQSAELLRFPVSCPYSNSERKWGYGDTNKRKWYAWYLVCVTSWQISLHDPEQKDSVLMIDNSHDLKFPWLSCAWILPCRTHLSLVNQELLFSHCFLSECSLYKFNI
jgi:hypothetical protein